MASQWFYQILGEELGPSSFQELAALARAGTLTRDDLVRRAEARDWILAGEVIGLFREDSPALQPVPAEPAGQAEPLPPQSPSLQSAAMLHPGRRSWKRVLFSAVLVGMTVAVLATLAWRYRTPRFPEPKFPAARARAADPAAFLPPRPSDPSIPGLKKLQPTLVPGLEHMPPAYAPCLSEDLRTILYCGPGHSGTSYDLYMARRDDPSSPFNRPQLVRSCASVDLDTRPALSPDALRLIFVRSDRNPQLFYTSRPSATAEFGQPVPLQFDALPMEGRHTATVQFLGPEEIVLRMKELATDNRFVYLLRAAGREAVFGSHQTLPVSNAWVMHFVANDKLRTYYGTEEGIFISGRGDAKQAFEPGVKLLDASVTGPIDGPIWVAPQEDVIFYCSAGPGKPMGSRRKLWLIAF